VDVVLSCQNGACKRPFKGKESPYAYACSSDCAAALDSLDEELAREDALNEQSPQLASARVPNVPKRKSGAPDAVGQALRRFVSAFLRRSLRW
jgi:hypothetical protein